MSEKKVKESKFPEIVPKKALTMDEIENLQKKENEEVIGERYYSRQFNKMYAVHKIMVLLKRAKAGKKHGVNTITNEQAYNKAVTLFNQALE